MARRNRRLIAEPIFQSRFAFTVGLVVLASSLMAFSVIYLIVIAPSSGEMFRASQAAVDESASLGKLVDVVSDPNVPAEQRLSLVRAEAADMAALIAERSVLIGSALRRMASPWRYVSGIVLALVFSGSWGLFWSRRIVGAEIGIMRRIEKIVDGDLRPGLLLRKNDELHFLRQGIIKSLEEMRSIARRDIQLMDEVHETVQQMCELTASEAGISDQGKSNLQVAIVKIGELTRISERYRLG